uniref:Protein tyrosine phosphatase n=1 Tax=Panagrolaimus sp. ES5 TaxID=591445 RepID=A0AC34F8Y6_9BILA
MAEGHHIALNQQEIFLDALLKVTKDDFKTEWKSLQNEQDLHPQRSTVFQKENLKPDKLATNRYETVACNDYQRVTINGGQYIHANFVQNSVGKKFIIATQGPLETTVADFWSMIVEQKTPLIVMLCNIIEDKFDNAKNEMVPTPKCFGYWPTLINTPIKTKSLFIYADKVEQIVFVMGQKQEKIIKTAIRIVDRKTNQILHKLDHFQYVDWEDHSIPSSTRPLMHLYKFYILPAIKKGGGPIVVHCSAGIGRTGVFVAAIFMLDLFLHSRLVTMPRVRQKIQKCLSPHRPTSSCFVF